MNKINNIKSTLETAKKMLDQNKIKNPHFEAELLLSFILKKDREYILTYPEQKISQTQYGNLITVVKKRTKNTPLAYICGYKYFFGLKFIVNKNVLVPRPETEMMVEEALKYSIFNNQYPIFVDIGTGSGCIAVAIAKELDRKNIRFDSYAIDISSFALAVAKKNAKLYGVHKFIKFYQGNLLEPILKKIAKSKIENRNSEIFITANLPYLTPSQIKNSPSIKKEPRLALVAGKDGLKYYRELFKQIKSINNCFKSAVLLLEIDHTQKSSITELIKQELPHAKFEIKKDLGGHYRLVKINY